MKRSEINAIMQAADDFIASFGFRLPPFAYWTESDFRKAGADAAAITQNHMGWDITDFGGGDFAGKGLFLFTARNGTVADLKAGRGMVYAEKIMISRKDQLCPMHRHDLKTEDIINRGGGELAIELFMSDAKGNIDPQRQVVVPTDGVIRRMAPGSVLKLKPGESVTLHPGVWHAFWGEGQDVLVGEVSTVNDDLTDNVFRDPVGRFPAIEEDGAPLHLLVGDYARLKL